MTRAAPGFLLAAAIGLAACAGDGDDDRNRTEAAAWCRVTATVDKAFDDSAGQLAWTIPITYDVAEEWVETAPEDVRASTEAAARILKVALPDPQPPELAEAREEIGAYAGEYCSSPPRCLADVEGNPRLPCARPVRSANR